MTSRPLPLSAASMRAAKLDPEPQHQRSITAAARLAPQFVARIEQSLTFTIGEDELVDALNLN